MAGINFYRVTAPETSAGTLDYIEDCIKNNRTPELGIERDLPEDVTELSPAENQSLAFDVDYGYMTDEIVTFIGHTLISGNSVQLHTSNEDSESPALLSVVVEEPEEPVEEY